MFHICRTCLQQIPGNNYVSLINGTKCIEIKTQLSLCIPELTIGLVTASEPVMCASCVSALHSAYTFKNRCLATEELIRNHIQKQQLGINLLEVIQENNPVLEEETPQPITEPMIFTESASDVFVKEEYTPPETEDQIDIKYDSLDNFKTPEEEAQNAHQKELQDLLQQRSKQPKSMADRPHKCDKCPFSSVDRSTLTKHKATHSEERPFACTICNYRTKRKDALTLHLKRHRAIKPNICPQCKYSAVTKQCLRRHIMVAHLELRPYKCDQCHLSFADQGTLTKHMLTHTDAKPYKCKMCDFSTKRKYTLKNHTKSHGKGTI